MLMEYLKLSQVGIITATLVTMIIYVYLYFLYRERHIGWWIIAWLIFIFRIFFFDTDYIAWNNSILGFIAYQLLYIVPAFLTLYGFHIFTNKALKHYWIYGSAIAAILGIVITFMQLPHPYKLAPPLWWSSIICIYIGKMLFDIKMRGIGKYILGGAFVCWGSISLIYPFIHYYKVALLAGPISGILRLILTAGLLILYYEKTRADLISSNQKSLEKMNLELQQTNQELNHFCHSVAHDFKSPLQSINKLSKYLMRDYAPKLDNDGQEIILHIQNKSAEIVTITDHLLELSTMSCKQIKLEPIPLGAVFHEVYNELLMTQPPREITFRLDPLPTIHGDPIMIKILVTNILANSLKYTRKQEQALIEVTSVDKGANYTISVKDNGAGFDMKHSHKLFKIFERLHSVDKFEGTGVGLVTCQKILKRHGGKAWMIGEVNAGATFYFDFPKNISTIDEGQSLSI